MRNEPCHLLTFSCPTFSRLWPHLNTISLPSGKKQNLLCMWLSTNTGKYLLCVCVYVCECACINVAGILWAVKYSAMLGINCWPFKVSVTDYGCYSCIYKCSNHWNLPSALEKFKVNCKVWNRISQTKLEWVAGHLRVPVSVAQV